MIRSLSVRNYQSIGLAELELGGLTVIVGRGDVGKSALLRALCALIFNETGDDFLRRTGGSTAKECEVSVGLDNDIGITWRRDSSGTRYIIEDLTGSEPPQQLTKLAGAVPEIVQDALAIRRIEVDKTLTVVPQIHGQFDAPLLLAESAGRAARILAKLTKLDVIVRAQGAAARDLRRAKQEAGRQEAIAADLEGGIADLPDAEAAYRHAKEAQDILARVQAQSRNIVEASRLAAERKALVLQLRARVPAEGVLDQAREWLATLAELVGLRDQLDAASVLLTTHRTAEKRAEEERAEAERTLEDYLSTLDICPVCERPMKPDPTIHGPHTYQGGSRR